MKKLLVVLVALLLLFVAWRAFARHLGRKAYDKGWADGALEPPQKTEVGTGLGYFGAGNGGMFTSWYIAGWNDRRNNAQYGLNRR